MSFAVVKGHATESQLRVDALLDAAAAGSGRPEDRYSLAALLFTCLKDRPHLLNTIEGAAGDQISNRDMLDKSIRAARAMQAARVAKGDVVIINGKNHLHLAVPYYASLFLGALPLHVDFNATATEMRHYINLSVPKFIFADANRITTNEEAICGTGITPQVVSFGQEVAPNHVDLVDFIRDFSGDADTFRLPAVGRYDPAVLACTSGSTGAPKATALTNFGMVTALSTFHHVSSVALGSDAHPKFLLSSSCQWLSYMYITNLCTVFAYTKIQYKQHATPDAILYLLRKYKPEKSFFAPGLLASTLLSPDYRAGDMSSMRSIVTGGAYVSPELQRKLKEAVHPEGRVVVAYGCTESSSILTGQTPTCPPESIGKELNVFKYKIVDENEKEVPVGETGELWVQAAGPTCAGYLKNENGMKDVMTSDGWLKTGDLIYKDEHDVYFYVDRMKLLIKSGMYHIYPAEVEKVICEVAGVGAAGVCWTERGLAALVAPRPGASAALTAQHVQDALKAKLSYYKQLDGGVYFVPELPHNISGKMDRGALKTSVFNLQAEQ